VIQRLLALGFAWATITASAILAPVYAASLDGLAVEVTSKSEPVLCAEKDNVTLNFASRETKSFRIEAAHPTYINTLKSDSFEADWTACDLSGDPAHGGKVTAPTRQTIYEEPGLWVVGWTFPTFWRPATALVRIGDKTFSGLHLVQIWMIRPMGGEEVLVFYPQDGYWRIRPLAPVGQAPTAFGSSFLVGPVEEEGRPIVRLKEVAFSPSEKTFSLQFERGGSATMVMTKTDHNRHALDVTFDKPVSDRPFAALRSMYVTEFNNDVARIAVREKAAKSWREEAIMSFKRASATDIWAGRHSLSQHNTSSPDMVFSGFSDGTAKRPTVGAPGSDKAATEKAAPEKIGAGKSASDKK
jgi:hypothetical protein